MPNFAYIALDAHDVPINGKINLSDRAAVINVLVKQGLRPLSIKEQTKTHISLNMTLGNSGNANGKVKSDHLVIMTRQLSTMINAGVPILRALSSLQKHTENPTLKKVLEGIMKDVQGGLGLGDAMAKYPKAFSDTYVNMVRAGEAAGILDDVLRRLALQQEKNATIRKKVKSAMAYPMVLMVIITIAFFGLMLFIIPQIGKIIKDLGGPNAQLPGITLFMLGLSHIITSYWFIIIPAIIALVFGAIRYIRTPHGKAQFDRLILKIPGVGPIAQKIAVARFARTFSALMSAGVAVLEALTVTGRAVGNTMFQEALREAALEVKNGRQLSAVIEENPIFPPIVAQMLSVGEETGQTDSVLLKVADFYDEEVDTAIDGLSSIIEPVMIVIMGSMVGLIAASVMVPIANLANTVQ